MVESPTTDASRVLIVLDVDGTISPIAPRGSHREPMYASTVAEPVLAALNEQIKRPGVTLGWTTSWAPAMLEWLVRERLNGRFDAPYLPDEADWQPGWRARAIIRAVAASRVDKIVWIDDGAVRSTLMRGLRRAGLSPTVLVIRPAEHLGVTLRQVHHAARFIDRRG